MKKPKKCKLQVRLYQMYLYNIEHCIARNKDYLSQIKKIAKMTWAMKNPTPINCLKTILRCKSKFNVIILENLCTESLF